MLGDGNNTATMLDHWSTALGRDYRGYSTGMMMGYSIWDPEGPEGKISSDPPHTIFFIGPPPAYFFVSPPWIFFLVLLPPDFFKEPHPLFSGTHQDLKWNCPTSCIFRNCPPLFFHASQAFSLVWNQVVFNKDLDSVLLTGNQKGMESGLEMLCFKCSSMFEMYKEV